MLYSMTGYGEAQLTTDTLSLAVELRAVNNRHLKVTLRAPEPYHLLEAEIERAIRRTLKRGTVQCHLHCRRQARAADFRIDAVALGSYLRQVRAACDAAGVAPEGPLAGVLALPGVVPEIGATALDLESEWPPLEHVLEQALAKLQAMRLEEGKAMAAELLHQRDVVAGQLELIGRRVPLVAESYRERLLERVRAVLGELGAEVERKDLIKEVAVFAERSDIREEVVRLGSHLGQFQAVISEPESAGRKLEFLTQEMFREANTIGSKASDVEVSRHVVEIKSALEKVRELVQNVE